MEILIPGLILVALMIYASTRIKRSAAQAYEPETVETDDFIIDKPAGFLTVIGGDPRYAFESYSKDFGGEAAPDFRKATAKITIFDTVDEAAKDLGDDETISDISEKIGGRSYRVTEARRTIGDVGFKIFRKSSNKGGRIIRLEIIVIDEPTDEFLRNIETMLLSFEVK
jgi:hypothetical protein